MLIYHLFILLFSSDFIFTEAYLKEALGRDRGCRKKVFLKMHSEKFRKTHKNAPVPEFLFKQSSRLLTHNFIKDTLIFLEDLF